MKKELTEVYCGSAKGKTTLALGHSLRAAAEGKSVIIIQFLKGKETRSVDFLEQLDDLDIKIFRFEKRDCCYDDLSDEEKAEERSNILNGLNFARKVVVTQECDFLLLDEILGVMEQGIVFCGNSCRHSQAERRKYADCYDRFESAGRIETLCGHSDKAH